MRRGVITGTALQGMAITVPLGALTFVVLATVTGTLGQVTRIPVEAMIWLAGQGIVHFVLGRYCNYRSNQAMGVNLSAPVVQLQVVWAIMLAVVLLGESFTVLQALGSILMVGGSFAVQQRFKTGATPAKISSFQPDLVTGYLYGLGAMIFYGTSPLLARQAFLLAPGVSTAAGGVVAYAGAVAAFALVLFNPRIRVSILGGKAADMGWFFAAAVLVAISQAFVYASLAVAPLMVVTPILQLSLIFRLFLSQFMNRDHEILNAAVVIGAAASIAGSILVSMHTGYLLAVLGFPAGLTSLLSFQIAGH